MTPPSAISIQPSVETGPRAPLLHSKAWWLIAKLLLLAVILLFTTASQGQTAAAPAPTPTTTPPPAFPAPSPGIAPMPITLNLGPETLTKPQDVDVAVRILFAITLLTLAPSIILLMTCFMRIAIVLSFVRTALSLQSTPSNQIVIGLSLFLTFFIMAPTWSRIDEEAIAPYRAQRISGAEAMERASVPIRGFMLKQTRPKDVELFVALAKLGPTAPEHLPLKVVIPGFIISELRTAFQMGFLLFIPFILIDLVVATVLMSMGMMMMPPVTISLPLKILLFVLVDGWNLIVRSVVLSFGG